MKVQEIKKGAADIKRGLVMMAIEGEESRCEKLAKHMYTAYGYRDTSCADEGDKEGDLVIYFVIDRDEVEHFRASFKAAKKEIK
ncbi:hypothetical protein SB5439_04969 [Klebsiella variicola]|uniref:hypothetical protein n=1 Tax=Klebsiella variicola TaxID=244366 RepID=UPI00109CDD20|nr:hypothetical protein [Klebsiella variicola]VGQ11584.1 hypothetical protein SB5439_04969 [Klebsiella variicola]